MEFTMIETGWLSILPPIIAIGLALITKEVYSSLFIGLFSGMLIYSFAGGGTVSAAATTFDMMYSKIADNAYMIIFLALLWAVVVLVSKSGGSEAYGRWAGKAAEDQALGGLCHVAAGRADLHRRRLQLPDRGHGDAPHHRPAEDLPGEAGLHHRRHRRAGVHHRAGVQLGGGGGQRGEPDRRLQRLPVHDPLQPLRAADHPHGAVHLLDRKGFRPDEEGGAGRGGGDAGRRRVPSRAGAA